MIGKSNDPWSRPAPVGIDRDNLFGGEKKPSIGLDLPMNNRREDLFGNGPSSSMLPSTYEGMDR